MFHLKVLKIAKFDSGKSLIPVVGVFDVVGEKIRRGLTGKNKPGYFHKQFMIGISKYFVELTEKFYDNRVAKMIEKYVTKTNNLKSVSSHIDDITEMAQNAKNHVMDTGNLFVDGKNISHLDDVVNIENIHEINAEAFTDIPVLEEMSAFENIKELLGNVFSDMDDTISDIFNVIKEEFLG